MGYLYLGCAVLFEVIATNALNASEQFTKLVPSIIVLVGYPASFYFLSLTLRTISVGTAYAIWAGLGIFLVTLSAAYFFKQIPDLPAIIGMALIVAGVTVINMFSKMVMH
uniref:Small multidrug resistance pump n=1 Tax=Candidatus Kentrum sp. LPFa TaxID=2126335 RepID=A0A450WRR0_9GAMM|nr:MAG: small multidrug resistance pump [Candidatus Kentron sp. LPFa]